MALAYWIFVCDSSPSGISTEGVSISRSGSNGISMLDACEQLKLWWCFDGKHIHFSFWI